MGALPSVFGAVVGPVYPAEAGDLPWSPGGAPAVAPPSAPTISGTVTIGGTLTITSGGGGPVDHYAEYQGGAATGRTVALGGSYTCVAADIDTGTDITFRAVGPGGTSADSNALRVATYVVSGFSAANYYASAAGTAPTDSTFTICLTFTLLAVPTAGQSWALIVGSGAYPTVTAGGMLFLNTNGLNLAVQTSGGNKYALPVGYALAAGDVGKTFNLYGWFDGTNVHLDVNGGEVAYISGGVWTFGGTAIAPSTYTAPGGSSFIGFSTANDLIGVIAVRYTPTVLTQTQRTDDSTSIAGRTSGLVFPTLSGETARYVAARLVGDTDWHDSDGDNLTLTVHGTPTLGAA